MHKASNQITETLYYGQTRTPRDDDRQNERKKIGAVVCEWIDGNATCLLKARTGINKQTEYKRADENVWSARVNLAP